MSSVDPPKYDGKNKDAASAIPKPATVEDEPALLSIVVKAFKSAGVAVGVWCWGYLGFSFAWLYIALFFHIASEELRKQKNAKKAYTKQAMCNEKEAIMSRVDQQDAWIYFPDIEKAEWVNKMIKQLWPPIAEYIQDLLMKSIEPMIQGSLNGFKFVNIDMGDDPPRIDGVKVYTDDLKKEQIILDVEIKYAGDANIKVAVKGLVAGIKGVKITGTVRIIMNPLIDDVPIIGGMSVFFLNKPHVDFDMTGGANLLDLPGLKSTMHSTVNDTIANLLVLPRRIPILLSSLVDITAIKYPPPQGVIVIHIVEARDLMATDSNILDLHGGKSDPYCKLSVGAQTFKTKAIQNNLNPVWNEFRQAIVDQKHGQFVDIQLFDEDIGTQKDDFLGFARIDIERTAKKGHVDLWLPLEDVKTGKIHVRAKWMNSSSNLADLIRKKEKASLVTMVASSITSASDTFATAVLVVVIEKATDIPVSDNTKKARNPYVTIRVENAVSKQLVTSVKQGTSNPTWDENFQFFLCDPENEKLKIEVCHRGSSDKVLSEILFHLSTVLNSDNMTTVKEFTLPNGAGTLSVRFIMRVLTSCAPPDWADLSGPAAASFADSMRQSFKMIERSSVSDKKAKEKSPEPVDNVKKDSKPKVSEEEKPRSRETTPVAPVVPNLPKPQPSSQMVGPPNQAAKEPEELKGKPRSRETTPAEPAPKPKETPGEPAPKPRETTPAKPNTTEEFKPKASEMLHPTVQPAEVKEIAKETVSLEHARKSDSPFGEIELSIRHSSQKNHLIVVVHRCRNLIPCDKDKLADPYIRLYLLPDRSSNMKKRSKMIKNNLNPVFDESFEWVVGAMELPFRTLDIAVKNDVGVFSKSRTDMGKVLIELSKLGDLSKAVTMWFDLSDPKSA